MSGDSVQPVHRKRLYRIDFELEALLVVHSLLWSASASSEELVFGVSASRVRRRKA